MADWSNAWFGCFGDFKLCIFTWCVPCYTAGKNAEASGVDGVKYTTTFMIPLVGIFCAAKVRGKVREKKGIDGSLINDLLCHCCCSPCALVQEAREMSSVKPEEFVKMDMARQ